MTNWYKNNHVCFQKLFFYATVKNPLLNHSSLVPVPVVWVDERVWNRFKHFKNICFCKVRYRVLLSVFFLSYRQRVQNNSFCSRLIKSIAFQKHYGCGMPGMSYPKCKYVIDRLPVPLQKFIFAKGANEFAERF